MIMQNGKRPPRGRFCFELLTDFHISEKVPSSKDRREGQMPNQLDSTSQPSSKRNAGQQILNKCPVCKSGLLLVRINHVVYHTEVIGGRGHPDSLTVHELVCSNCCVKFVAADEGKDIWPIIEADLKKFSQPDNKPTHCPVCENDSFNEGQTPRHSHEDDWGPFGGRDPQRSKRTHYLYCKNCLTPVYITRQPTT